MFSRCGFMMGVLVGATGCAQIIDSDAPYILIESSSSAGGAGGTGGLGGTGGAGGGQACTNDAECPSTGLNCTVASCIDGTCGTKSAMGGTPCSVGTPYVCDGQGACVECTVSAHCLGIVEDQCTKRACVNNACQLKYLGAESPASPTLQQPGDCKAVVCDGSGGTKTVQDDTDTPDDNNGCTTDTCLNGTKVSTKVEKGTNCGVNSLCDETGQCVGCVEAANCSGSYDFCKAPTCLDGICGVSYIPDGTPLPVPDQTAKDCRILVCDGAGNIVTRVETADIPVDGNVCTQDWCDIDGTPSNPPEPIGLACGDDEACDGLGTCRKTNGTPCGMGNECASTYCVDAVCCESACNGTCHGCNASPMTAGTCTMVPFGQKDTNATIPCIGVESCDGNGVCKKGDGQTCSATSECSNGFCVDGYCCENACTATCKACSVSGALGKCVNIPTGSKDDVATLECNGTQACDGNGMCKLDDGQPCSSGGECASAKCIGNPKTCQP